MVEEDQQAATARDEAQRAVGRLGRTAGDFIGDYAELWLTSLQQALNGEYTPSKLVSDAGRLTSRLVRDWAKLSVLAYEALEKVADIPARDKAPTPGSETGRDGSVGV